MAISEPNYPVFGPTGSEASSVDPSPTDHPPAEGGFSSYQSIHDSVVVAGSTIQFTVEVPDKITHEGVGIIANGFGGFKSTARGLGRTLAELGLPSVRYETLRKDDTSLLKRFKDPQEAHVMVLEAITSGLKANRDLLRRVKQEQSIDLERQRLLGYSMGNAAVMLYALEHDQDIEAVVSMMGVGYGSPNLADLAKNLPRKIPAALWHELRPYLGSGEIDVDLKSLIKFIRYYFSHPTRTASEMYSCLSIDLRPAAQELGRLGVRNTYLAGEYDCLVPPDDSIEAYVGLYSVMPGGGHLLPLLKPLRTAPAAIALSEGRQPEFSLAV